MVTFPAFPAHENPSIAVIIPVYEVTTYLEEALRSVNSQRVAAAEILLVDDGSSAAAAADIRRIATMLPGVSLIVVPHAGAAAARHAGACRATAGWITFLDADDVLLPNALSCFARTIRAEPTTAAVYARRQRIDSDGVIISGPQPEAGALASGAALLQQLLQLRTPFCNGSICVNRQVLLALEPNNHHLLHGEDWALWVHLAISGNILPAGDEVVLHRRIHDRNSIHTLVEDPNTVLATFEAVFTHPAVIAALGKEYTETVYRLRCEGAHAYYAGHFARKGEHAKAAHHFSHITRPLAELQQDIQYPQR